MWALLIVSSLVFGFFATQLRFEEDIIKLLPKTQRAEENSLAFDQLAIKDKLFVQITGSDDPAVLAAAADSFVEQLTALDSCDSLVASLLYRLEDDWIINGIDYAVSQFPTLIDSSVYHAFDTLLLPAALDRQMVENARIIDEDMDGTATGLLSYDPAGLRHTLLQQFGDMEGMMGYAIVEGHLMTPDSTVALIFIQPSFNSSYSGYSAQLVSLAEKAGAAVEADNEGVEVLFHGTIEMSSGNSRRIKMDLVTTVLLSILLIVIVLIVCLGHRSSWRHLLLPVLYGTAFAMAMMYWIKGSMSMMAMGIAALVLGIAMSYVLHLIVHHKYIGDPERVVREQTKPVCLSCLTTIGAFLSLLFTSSELLADFGLFASLALVGTTFCTLVFLPQFFTEANSTYNAKAFRLLDRVAAYPLDRKPALLIAFVVICLAAFIASPFVRFDSDLNNIGYFTPRNIRSQQLYDSKVNQGHQAIYLAATSADVEEAMRINRTLDSVLSTLEQEQLCYSHSSLAPFCLTTDEQQQNIDAWQRYWTPQRRDMAQRNIAAAARRHDLDPEIFDGFAAITEADYSPDLILCSEALPAELACNFVEQVDGNYLIFTSVLADADKAYDIYDRVDELPGIIVCDPYYYTGDMVNIVHDNFNLVMYISMIFVFIVLLLSFRNLLLTILAFLPMFVSWYVVQGIMALCGIEFNLINCILSSFIFGVGVDYSIFTVSGLIGQARGDNPELLARHRTAIILSAFMLVVVSASLLFAVHPAIHSVGGCTLIGMLTAILLSAAFQPFLFRQLMKLPRFRKSVTGER